MDQNPKSSIATVVVSEVLIVAALVVLILGTLNYFNIFSLSKVLPFLSFLPHQAVKTANISRVPSASPSQAPSAYVPRADGKCQYLPSNVSTEITAPSSTISATLSAFSGIWEGKWNDSTSTVLLVRTINASQIDATYIFQNQVPRAMKLIVQPDGKTLKSMSGFFTWQINQEGLLQGILTGTTATSTTTMTRCTP